MQKKTEIITFKTKHDSDKLTRGRGMKYFLILSTMLITGIFAQNVNPETGWAFDQSTLQAFYMLETLTVDGEIAESEDVVGAFFDGECVGWVNASPQGYTTIPLMGSDGESYSEAYLNSGEVPELFIFDASNGSILPVESGSDLPGWQ